jgi:hypothetical protein
MTLPKPGCLSPNTDVPPIDSALRSIPPSGHRTSGTNQQTPSPDKSNQPICFHSLTEQQTPIKDDGVEIEEIRVGAIADPDGNINHRSRT